MELVGQGLNRLDRFLRLLLKLLVLVIDGLNAHVALLRMVDKRVSRLAVPA